MVINSLHNIYILRGFIGYNSIVGDIHYALLSLLAVSSYSTSISTEEGDVLIDYSKNLITEDTMKMLFNLVCTV